MGWGSDRPASGVSGLFDDIQEPEEVSRPMADGHGGRIQRDLGLAADRRID